jgi:hypothetical protein
VASPDPIDDLNWQAADGNDPTLRAPTDGHAPAGPLRKLALYLRELVLELNGLTDLKLRTVALAHCNDLTTRTPSEPTSNHIIRVYEGYALTGPLQELVRNDLKFQTGAAPNDCPNSTQTVAFNDYTNSMMQAIASNSHDEPTTQTPSEPTINYINRVHEGYALAGPPQELDRGKHAGLGQELDRRKHVGPLQELDRRRSKRSDQLNDVERRSQQLHQPNEAGHCIQLPRRTNHAKPSAHHSV